MFPFLSRFVNLNKCAGDGWRNGGLIDSAFDALMVVTEAHSNDLLFSVSSLSTRAGLPSRCTQRI